VGRVAFEQLLERSRGLPAVDERRKAQREFQGRVRALDVAGRRWKRKTVGSRDRQCGAPRAIQDQLHGIRAHRLREDPVIAATAPRETPPQRFAQDPRGLLRLRQSIGGDIALERGIQDRACARIVDAVQKLARDAL
jgi:hypothetical protein